MQAKGSGGGGVIVISDKIHFKSKTVTRDKVGHYIMLINSSRVCNNCTQGEST